ncbi:hypothetical protein WKK05_08690 [Nostoc sp. UHCC 0302]|uniref:hypothetical protein n=1 Tax=Nostoc sp. UHCC 0302 TaxID=3134896 RepID=UPI00311C9622
MPQSKSVCWAIAKHGSLVYNFLIFVPDANTGQYCEALLEPLPPEKYPLLGAINVFDVPKRTQSNNESSL